MTGLFDTDIERRARQFWAERELAFPAFTRMAWEQGTALARAAAMAQVAASVDTDRMAETGTGSGRSLGSAVGEAETPNANSDRTTP